MYVAKAAWHVLIVEDVLPSKEARAENMRHASSLTVLPTCLRSLMY